MAESKPVTIRIPDAWLAQIEELAAQKYPGRKGNPNKSQVVLDAIEFYFQHLNNDSENNVHDNDNVISVNQQLIQQTVNLAVEQQIAKLTLNLTQALSHCFTTFTDAQPNKIESILEQKLVTLKPDTDSLKPKPTSNSKKSQAQATQSPKPSKQQKLEGQNLTREQMYKFLGISSRTLDHWIRKAKAKSDPPIISHQGRSWRYIPTGKGLGKVFVLIEDE